jgi:hypothetical protein
MVGLAIFGGIIGLSRFLPFIATFISRFLPAAGTGPSEAVRSKVVVVATIILYYHLRLYIVDS